MLRTAINVIAFQAGWFAAVLGAAHDMAWFGICSIPAILGLHLILSPDWKPELLLAFTAAVIGFVFDTLLIVAGIFTPVFYLLPPPFSPPWMVLLWVNFSITLNVSLVRLHGRYRLGALLGAVGGPVAYLSGAKLGAMTEIPDMKSLFVLSAAWAAAVPVLLLTAARIRRRFSP